MTLQNGTRLGPYEIVSRIGAGGMGEVFRAKDTRLDRTVAVKTLPSELANNTQLRIRFQREAKAISALSHPNICALYDVGEHEGVDYLVMEYLEGETLAERVARGALPLKEALRVGIEVAAALERAHREGVVPRDLKPGNVMLTRNGAKLLDFGLAKAAARQPISAEAPTVQHADAPLTAEGTIVGTFQYMAPEQIEGADVDARTDIFAFGTLLYEMITGTRAFSGRTRTSLIASIVASVPRPMAEIAPVTPPELEHVVQRCLEKEPEARWQSAHDVRLELEWIAKSQGTARAVTKQRRRIWPWLAGAIAFVAGALAAYLAASAMRTQQGTALQTHVLAPKGHSFSSLMDTLSVSPDGRFVTFSVDNDSRLWVRPLASNEARPLAGTEFGTFPFWSPDSRWIAYFDREKLKKVTLTGAPPVTLCAAGNGRSGTWNEEGVILFSPSATTEIFRISANGGTPQPVTKLDVSLKETTHRWPLFLPDGKRFLYFAGGHQETLGSEAHAIYLTSLDRPKERTLVTRARSNALYARGHLLYVKDQLLVAQPFDLDRGTLGGEPFRIAEGLEYDADYFRGTFAATAGGDLIYRTLVSPPNGRLTWFEGSKPGEPVSAPRPFRHLRVSPDGKRAVAAVTDRSTGLTDLWLFDLRTAQETRLTSTPTEGEESPVWSPDGQQVLFSRHRGFKSGGDLFVIRPDGNGNEQVIYRTTNDTRPRVWAKSGLALIDHADDSSGTRREDVMVLLMEPDSKPRMFLSSEANEALAAFSPDGRWVGYASSDSGRAPQVFASRFPEASSKVQLSPRTAFQIAWFADGVYIGTPQGLFHVPVRVEGDRLIVGAERLVHPPEPLAFSGDFVPGDRQLLAIRTSDPYDDTITVTTDWSSR